MSVIPPGARKEMEGEMHIADLHLLLTLHVYEEHYSLGSLFVPVPVVLILAISN